MYKSCRTILTVFLFGVRGFASGLFQAIYLYTPEVCMSVVLSANVMTHIIHSIPQVYPTSVRAFGMSLCSSFSRIGGMLSPYIAQVWCCNDEDSKGKVFCKSFTDFHKLQKFLHQFQHILAICSCQLFLHDKNVKASPSCDQTPFLVQGIILAVLAGNPLCYKEHTQKTKPFLQ